MYYEEIFLFCGDVCLECDFKCTKCKSIHDIFVEQNPPVNHFRPEFSLPEGFEADKTQYNIWGICPNCKE